ncbi:hypothetical protein V7T14_04760 [Segatella copri]|uniref:hypothetical protein n=1 Tax=Segatella copri TaxID=165179 RepID=UPI001C47404B|nr:hypothetical protein [Segatella copri]MBW0030770.1 hypothetical protein [Segatella copri]
METEINIVEILKDKPQGTKLYSSACGKCKLEEVDDKSFKISFYNSKFGFMNGGEGYLDKNGKLYDDGECVVFPSKEMRDWRKFSWKKGDVLVNKDGDVYIIFERFVDDTYCSFVGKYYLWKENNDTEQFYEKERLLTSDFQKAGKDAAQTYINTIEKRLGDKLNRETLEIEKTQPEFKDGDIVCISGMGYLAYGIVKSIDNSSKKLEYYVLNDMSTLKFEDWLSFEDKQIQPITETQQIILFDALEKEGKAWDAEKKQFVDIKKEHQFKPFEKVLVRDYIDDVWRASFFSHIKENDGRYVTTCVTWKFCIPYIGNESLLGTTKDVEG